MIFNKINKQELHKIGFAAFFILVVLLSHAQNKFAQPNSVWGVITHDHDGIRGFRSIVTGDTTINGKSFSMISQWDRNVAVRNVDRKVYSLYLDDMDSTEHVLYDFNLALGDTIFLEDLSVASYVHVDSVLWIVNKIGSIQLYDKTFKKSIELFAPDYWCENNWMVWIEDVGSNWGPLPLYFSPQFENFYELSYFHIAGNCLYGNCLTDIKECTDVSNIMYFHSGKIHFKNIEKNMPLVIYDCMGNEVFRANTSNNVELDVSFLPSAIYYCTAEISSKLFTLKFRID
ncbi:MAG: hypothetical protein ACERKD_15745 [Prolixibacteraceae bacterium]